MKNMSQVRRPSLKLEPRLVATTRNTNEVELQTVPVYFTTRAYTKHDINTCDNCEEYSDDLMEKNGQWLCEDCREFES